MSDDLARGVHNPKVVDLVAEDPESGEIVLTILEQRAWGADPQQLHQLQDKLNSYLGYALDGYLARDYPDYGGRPVRFELVCSEAPGPDQTGTPLGGYLKNFGHAPVDLRSTTCSSPSTVPKTQWSRDRTGEPIHPVKRRWSSVLSVRAAHWTRRNSASQACTPM